MALIVCPECKREVSSTARQCVHCGYPLASQVRPVEIEQTAKRFKRDQLIGLGIFILGAASIIIGYRLRLQLTPVFYTGITLMVVGIGCALMASIRAWWHHG